MKQPEGFVDETNPSKVCRLKKSLYGLKQSARCWNQVIDRYLKSSGYIQSDADPCIYYKRKTIDGKQITVIIAVYVDDTIICSNDTVTLKTEKKNLSDQFEMDDRGELDYILGIVDIGWYWLVLMVLFFGIGWYCYILVYIGCFLLLLVSIV